MSCLCLVFKLFFIIKILTSVACDGSYTVTAPGLIKSNRKYTVCATLHNVSEPATLRIGIQSKFSWNAMQEVSLQPFESKMLDFFPPKLDTSETYDLTAEGVNGLNFKNRKELLVGMNSGANIYIETDRGTYKPADVVKFRIIILDEHSKPLKIIEPIKVQIFDGLKNRVKQFKDIRLNKGVYAQEFQISKEPVLGTWEINVFIGGKYDLEKIAKIKVEKYILPKFSVHIETDRNFVVEDRIMKINVFGRYTYNKYVEGKVDLEVSKMQGRFNTLIANRTADIVDFKANFEFDLNSLIGSETTQFKGWKMNIKALLREKHTGIIQSATTDVEFKTQRYKIIIPGDEIQFRNEVPFRIMAEVQHWNGTIVNDPVTPVYMEHGPKTYESKLDKNGKALFEFEYSRGGYDFRYKDSTETKVQFHTYRHNTESCQLSLKQKRPQLNSTIEILVEPEEPMPYLIYTLVAHGNIIKHEFVHFDSNRNSYTIQLTPSIEMVPISFLYVHYILYGFLNVCETKIKLPDEFENKLSISAPQNVKPGENITMKVNAQLDSHVSILAVDLSSLLLNSANKMSKMEVLDNMRNDLSYSLKGQIRNEGLISGLVTLTDAQLSKMAFRDYEMKDRIRNLLADKEEPRSIFPETWIYKDLEITNEMTAFNLTVPDTITTWIVTAFSVNEETGFGIIDPSMEILAFKTFFINTYLPYSVKLGEIVSIPIMIFNYHQEDLSTEVIMDNSLNEFKFVDEKTSKTTDSSNEKRNIIVPANSGNSVNFLIYPQKLGKIEIRLKAKNKLSSDGVVQKLAVEPSGLATFKNHDLYLTLKPGQDFSTRYTTSIPKNALTDFTYLKLAISGNVLVSSLENLDNLVDKPTGCGEQNMINLVPNILVLEYLRASRQTSKYPVLVAKAKKFIEIGYQQEMTFRHPDGSYSVFGPKLSKTPSNWLTAYVIRIFIKGVKYLPIESHIIESGLDFLSKQQSSNGEFIDAGYLFQPAHQNRYAFTAFVLLTFMENETYGEKYKQVIQKALAFLTNNSKDVSDTYSLAIMVTALQSAKHEHASVILNRLQPLAKTQADLKWWTSNTEDRVADIEITSYILLALMDTPGEYLSIVKWLLEQRNSHGGFKSTQDTVVGLQALIKFSQISIPQENTLIKVSYRAFDIKNEEIENSLLGLDPENLMIMQNHELPPLTRSVEISISGTGSVFLQFSYQYQKEIVNAISIGVDVPSTADLKVHNYFIIKTNVKPSPNNLTLELKICFQYKPLKDVKYLKTNMIIAEVNLPSGYIMNPENLEDLEAGDTVDRVNNEKPDTLILYFPYLEPNKEKCVNIAADKKDDVRNLKPSVIVIYDYYHSEYREEATYEIVNN